MAETRARPLRQVGKDIPADDEFGTGTHDDDERGCAGWSDATLIAGVARQSEDAYAELYRRHYSAVKAVTRMILGAGSGWEEVVADVFVAVWLSPQEFDPARSSLLSFLRLKARCRSIDVLRSEASRARREQGSLATGDAPLLGVDATVLASECARELRHAVASLPPAERDAIHLAFFSGMTYRGVAQHLNVAEGTVKSRIRNGLRHLSLSEEVQLHHGIRTPAALADLPDASAISGPRQA